MVHTVLRHCRNLLAFTLVFTLVTPNLTYGFFGPDETPTAPSTGADFSYGQGEYYYEGSYYGEGGYQSGYGGPTTGPGSTDSGTFGGSTYSEGGYYGQSSYMEDFDEDTSDYSVGGYYDPDSSNDSSDSDPYDQGYTGQPGGSQSDSSDSCPGCESFTGPDPYEEAAEIARVDEARSYGENVDSTETIQRLAQGEISDDEVVTSDGRVVNVDDSKAAYDRAIATAENALRYGLSNNPLSTTVSTEPVSAAVNAAQRLLDRQSDLYAPIGDGILDNSVAEVIPNKLATAREQLNSPDADTMAIVEEILGSEIDEDTRFVTLSNGDILSLKTGEVYPAEEVSDRYIDTDSLTNIDDYVLPLMQELDPGPKTHSYKLDFDDQTGLTTVIPLTRSPGDIENLDDYYLPYVSPLSPAGYRALGMGRPLTEQPTSATLHNGRVVQTTEAEALAVAIAGELSAKTRNELTAAGGDYTLLSEPALREVHAVLNVIEQRALIRDTDLVTEVFANNGVYYSYSSIKRGAGNSASPAEINFSVDPQTYRDVIDKWAAGELAESLVTQDPTPYADHFLNPYATRIGRSDGSLPSWHDAADSSQAISNKSNKSYHEYLVIDGYEAEQYRQSFGELPPHLIPIKTAGIQPMTGPPTVVQPDPIREMVPLELTELEARAHKAISDRVEEVARTLGIEIDTDGYLPASVMAIRRVIAGTEDPNNNQLFGKDPVQALESMLGAAQFGYGGKSLLTALDSLTNIDSINFTDGWNPSAPGGLTLDEREIGAVEQIGQLLSEALGLPNPHELVVSIDNIRNFVLFEERITYPDPIVTSPATPIIATPGEYFAYLDPFGPGSDQSHLQQPMTIPTFEIPEREDPVSRALDEANRLNYALTFSPSEPAMLALTEAAELVEEARRLKEEADAALAYNGDSARTIQGYIDGTLTGNQVYTKDGEIIEVDTRRISNLAVNNDIIQQNYQKAVEAYDGAVASIYNIEYQGGGVVAVSPVVTPPSINEDDTEPRTAMIVVPDGLGDTKFAIVPKPSEEPRVYRHEFASGVTVEVTITCFDDCEGEKFLMPHPDELTAEAFAHEFAARNDGAVITIKQYRDGELWVSEDARNLDGILDANRILNPESAAMKAAVGTEAYTVAQEIAAFIKPELEGSDVVALHTNTHGGFGFDTYAGDLRTGSNPNGSAIAVHRADPNSDRFVLVATQEEFDREVAKGEYNVVLENVDAALDDGSASFYCAGEGSCSYRNLEVEDGHTGIDEHRRMLEVTLGRSLDDPVPRPAGTGATADDIPPLSNPAVGYRDDVVLATAHTGRIREALDEMQAAISGEERVLIPADAAVYPVNGGRLHGYSNGFGPRDRDGDGNTNDDAPHEGVDLYGEDLKEDTTVIATSDGVIVGIRTNSGGYGKYVDILTDRTVVINGVEKSIVERHAHVEPDADIQIGDRVTAGQQVAVITGWGTDFGDTVQTMMDTQGIDLETAYDQAVDYFEANGWGSVTKPHNHYEHLVDYRPDHSTGGGYGRQIDPNLTMEFERNTSYGIGTVIGLDGGPSILDARNESVYSPAEEAVRLAERAAAEAAKVIERLPADHPDAIAARENAERAISLRYTIQANQPTSAPFAPAEDFQQEGFDLIEEIIDTNRDLAIKTEAELAEAARSLRAAAPRTEGGTGGGRGGTGTDGGSGGSGIPGTVGRAVDAVIDGVATLFGGGGRSDGGAGGGDSEDSSEDGSGAPTIKIGDRSYFDNTDAYYSGDKNFRRASSSGGFFSNNILTNLYDTLTGQRNTPSQNSEFSSQRSREVEERAGETKQQLAPPQESYIPVTVYVDERTREVTLAREDLLREINRYEENNRLPVLFADPNRSATDIYTGGNDTPFYIPPILGGVPERISPDEINYEEIVNKDGVPLAVQAYTVLASESIQPPILFNDQGEVVYSNGVYAPPTVAGKPVNDSEDIPAYVYLIQYINDDGIKTVEANDDILPGNFFTNIIKKIFSDNSAFSVNDVVEVTYELIDPRPAVPRDEYYRYVIRLNDGSIRETTVPEFSSIAFMRERFAEVGYQGNVIALISNGREIYSPRENDRNIVNRALDLADNALKQFTSIFGGQDTEEKVTDLPENVQATDWSIENVEKLFIYPNAYVDCPQVEGLYDGYVYKAVLKDHNNPNEAITITEARCGLGDPLTLVAETAYHLENAYGITPLPLAQLVEKTVFNIDQIDYETGVVASEIATIKPDPNTGAAQTIPTPGNQDDEFIPNTTNTVSFAVKATDRLGNVLVDWTTNDLSISGDTQLHFRWDGSDYNQCLPFLNDGGRYSLSRSFDQSMKTGNTEAESYDIVEASTDYWIECGGQNNGEFGVDRRVIEVSVE